jgi:hypothetical protein
MLRLRKVQVKLEGRRRNDKYIYIMTDIDGSCSFSCTYSKKKTYEMLENLLKFAEYDPGTAMDVIDEISENVNYARHIIHAMNNN